MSADLPPKVITLNPGEYAFAEGESVLQTLLGSCVAVTFWDPKRRLGAMCHFILPERPKNTQHKDPGCYADEALRAITQRFHNMGIQAENLEVRMFGGGNMFPDLPLTKKVLIGDQNIEAGQVLLEALGFSLSQVDLAGDLHRKITFEVYTGRVLVKLGDKVEPGRKGKT